MLNSRYSELAGIPIAYLGFAVYVAIGSIQLLETRVAFLRQWGLLLMFGIGLFAWLFSMWLVYVQVALLEALCPWCLTHETNFTISIRLDLLSPLPRDLQRSITVDGASLASPID